MRLASADARCRSASRRSRSRRRPRGGHRSPAQNRSNSNPRRCRLPQAPATWPPPAGQPGGADRLATQIAMVQLVHQLVGRLVPVFRRQFSKHFTGAMFLEVKIDSRIRFPRRDRRFLLRLAQGLEEARRLCERERWAAGDQAIQGRAERVSDIGERSDLDLSITLPALFGGHVARRPLDCKEQGDVRVPSLLPSLASPKSVTLAGRRASTRMLAGFRSRWMTPRAWA